MFDVGNVAGLCKVDDTCSSRNDPVINVVDDDDDDEMDEDVSLVVEIVSSRSCSRSDIGNVAQSCKVDDACSSHDDSVIIVKDDVDDDDDDNDNELRSQSALPPFTTFKHLASVERSQTPRSS